MPPPTTDQRRAVLSIDLGASFTKLAWRPEWKWDDAVPGEQNTFTEKSSPLKLGSEYLIPSLAYDPGNGGPWHFGTTAARLTPGSNGKLHTNWKAVLFDPSAAENEVRDATDVASRFLEWLRGEIAVAGKAIGNAHTRLCVPAFADATVGLHRLREAFEGARWTEHDLFRVFEPEANVVGLASGGRNWVRVWPGHGPEPDFGKMFPEHSPLIQAARDELILGRHPVKTCVIDIGAYTTDVAVCFLGLRLEVQQQESFKHGVSRVDAELQTLIRQKGGCPDELSQDELEIIKKRVYHLEKYELRQKTSSVVLQGIDFEHSLTLFADELLEKVAPLVRDVRWIVLTGGGALIPSVSGRVIAKLRELGCREIREFFEESDHRLDTAIGGCSVALEFTAASPSTRHAEREPGEIECSCRGGHKDCIRCGGTGYRTPTRVPHPQMPGRSVGGLEPATRTQPDDSDGASPPTPALFHQPVRPSVSRAAIAKPNEPAPRPAERPITEPVCIGEVGREWRRWHQAGLSEFTLEGWMGKVVFPNGPTDAPVRRDTLLSADTLDGRIAWWRLLCLGTSLGIRIQRATLKRHWDGDLAEVCTELTPTVPEESASSEFTRRTDEYFEQVIHRQFRNRNCSGEDADLWRRVFYDFRKMHYLVFVNDLPEVLLELLRRPNVAWDAIVSFVKSGHHPEGRWAGVIGQSMTAPMLFLMRELRRLGATDGRFDAACFYMNGPARRVARQLRWISDQERLNYDFESLLELSRKCHDRMEVVAPNLLEFFDLPLQWFAHQDPMVTYEDDET